MAVDPSNLTLLVSVPDELEAAQIVCVLEEHGIRATQTGGFTSGFRAEAPGQVRVMVRHVDYDRARTLLAQIPSERADIDWSMIDFGDASLSSDQDDEQADPQGRHPFQFSMRMLLGLQTLFCVMLGFLLGPYPGLFIAVIVVGGTFALIIFGTVQIASDLTDARQAWKYVGQALLLSVMVFGLFQLIVVLL